MSFLDRYGSQQLVGCTLESISNGDPNFDSNCNSNFHCNDNALTTLSNYI